MTVVSDVLFQCFDENYWRDNISNEFFHFYISWKRCCNKMTTPWAELPKSPKYITHIFFKGFSSNTLHNFNPYFAKMPSKIMFKLSKTFKVKSGTWKGSKNWTENIKNGKKSNAAPYLSKNPLTEKWGFVGFLWIWGIWCSNSHWRRTKLPLTKYSLILLRSVLLWS